MPEISILIPVYNNAEYLSECLDSLLNQTYQDFEIICVNDCSPDNSLEVLEHYHQKDSRIKIINKERNGGLSTARNEGLAHAQGKYIYFCDGDDWLDNNYLEKMHDAAVQTNADVVLNTNILTHNGVDEPFQHEIRYTQNYISNVFLKPEDCILRIIWNVWAYFWKKSFLDAVGARFCDGCKIDDMYFQSTVLPFTQKIYVIRDCTYHYRIRKNSITSNANINNSIYDICIECYEKIFEFYQNRNMAERINFKLFTSNIIPLFQHPDKQKLLAKIKQYFMSVQEIVQRTRNLYESDELEFFDCVIRDKWIDFYKHLFSSQFSAKLRNNVVKNIQREVKHEGNI